MADLNKCHFIGRLVRDFELRYTANNTAVAKSGIAIDHKYTLNGEKKKDTTFIDVEAWARSAETLSRYTRKGDPIYLECRMKLEQWEAQDGGRRSKLVAVVEGFQFLSSKPRSDEGGASNGDTGEFPF